MALTTFTDTLRSEVAFLQAAHPERLGDIARAHAAIVEGHVVDEGDGNGRVLSRDGHTWYTTNGVCSCQAAEFGKPCRHLSAWKLYRHVAAKHAQLHAPVEPLPDAQDEPSAAPQTVAVLPEAPASVNCHIQIAGRQVQLTLRDSDERRLLARLAEVLRDYPMEQTPLVQTPQARPQATQEAPLCEWHGRMKPSKYGEGQWFCPAKKGDGTRCTEVWPKKNR